MLRLVVSEAGTQPPAASPIGEKPMAICGWMSVVWFGFGTGAAVRDALRYGTGATEYVSTV